MKRSMWGFVGQVESARLVAVQVLIGNRKLSPLVLVYLVAPVSYAWLFKHLVPLAYFGIIAAALFRDDRLSSTHHGRKRGVRRPAERRDPRARPQWRACLCAQCRWGVSDPFGREPGPDLVGGAQGECLPLISL